MARFDTFGPLGDGRAHRWMLGALVTLVLLGGAALLAHGEPVEAPAPPPKAGAPHDGPPPAEAAAPVELGRA